MNEGDRLPRAGIDFDRVGAAVLAGVIAVILLVIVVSEARRWLRARRAAARASEVPRKPALARFTDIEITDSRTFGGGAWSARVRRRHDTVTYGYLAVAEEHASPDSGGQWCTLTVTLPGRVPFLVIDNRAGVGRPGVPLDAPQHVALDDPPFDATYVVGAADPEQAARVLSPAAREVLLRARVQRLMLDESQLQLRTLDGVGLDDGSIEWLNGVAARFLSSTPSFVSSTRQPTPPSGSLLAPEAPDAPLREGLYGTGGE
jgi:hypothetical protein